MSRPTFRDLTKSYESWAYRNGFFKQVSRLERQDYLERDATRPDDRLYRLTPRGRPHILGGREILGGGKINVESLILLGVFRQAGR